MSEIADGQLVRVVNTPDIMKHKLGFDVNAEVVGRVVKYDPTTSNYVVDVNGTHLIVAEENLLVKENARSLLQRVTSIRESELAARASTLEAEPAVSTDVFDTEIARLFGSKVELISDKLAEMKTSWAEIRGQHLGQDLTDFIGYAMTYLDHLIILVGTVTEEKDLSSALSAFEKWFKMSAEVVDSTQVTAWVETQLEQLDTVS